MAHTTPVESRGSRRGVPRVSGYVLAAIFGDMQRTPCMMQGELLTAPPQMGLHLHVHLQYDLPCKCGAGTFAQCCSAIAKYPAAHTTGNGSSILLQDLRLQCSTATTSLCWKCSLDGDGSGREEVLRAPNGRRRLFMIGAVQNAIVHHCQLHSTLQVALCPKTTALPVMNDIFAQWLTLAAWRCGPRW
jgi:hypothetical protein